MGKVLVTGGTGFVGGHAVARLLSDGHQVRATVRKADRQPALLDMLRQTGIADFADLDVRVADLESDEGWESALAGCDYVLHVASPFPAQQPQDEQELIRPAREGTLRVLRHAKRVGVRRVVMTSSFAAVGYGHPPQSGRVYTEADWTNLQAPLPLYIKSKTLAERAAWEFVEGDGRGLELVAINPTGIFGPVLGPDYSSSIGLVKQMLDGKMPGAPRLFFGVVDVRDVVDLHIRAMVESTAAGQRFIAVAGKPLSLLQVAQAIRAHSGPEASRVPKRELPDWLVRFLAHFNAKAKSLASGVGQVRTASNEKARTMLGWQPRSSEEAVVASAASLLKLDLTEKGR